MFFWFDASCLYHPEHEVVGRAGELPNLVNFIASSKKRSEENPFCEVLTAAQNQPAESLLMGESHVTNANAQRLKKTSNFVARNWADSFNKQAEEMPFNSIWEHKRHRDVKVEMKSEVGTISGGATGALKMLHAYMKALETTHNPLEGSVMYHNFFGWLNMSGWYSFLRKFLI